MSENKNMSSEISTSNDDYNVSNNIDEEGEYSDYEDNEDNHHRHHDHDNHQTNYKQQQQHNNTNDDNENRRSKESKLRTEISGRHTQLTVLSDRNLNLKRKYDG